MNRSIHTRRAGRLALALLVASTVAAGLAASAGAVPTVAAPHAQRLIPERARGEAAIHALGARLPAVAAAHGTTADVLRSRLRTDDQLWVDPTGALLFVDESHMDNAEVPVSSAPDPVLGDQPTASAFSLRSRPGADRVLYLDFDGHSTPGGGWSKAPRAPYDLDGNPAAFSDAERRVVIDVWRHVAEDFAPFDIDVTTQDPGVDAIRRTTSTDQQYGSRVVITPTVADCSGCGGIAYVGTFDITGGSDSSGWTHDHYQPAFVHISGSNAKHIAEAASHEAGHNLGLSHDGVTGGDEYYTGHGDWAPIMGVGYYEPISQWSRGEYAGASNTEDDLAVIAANGGSPVADDHGASQATATVLPAGAVDVSGVIGDRADVDAFTFTAGDGTLALDVAPAGVGADADLSLRLVDDTGATVELVDPIGLSASLHRTIAAGTYRVVVDGVGVGSPSGPGYSDYASLGRYRLTGSVPASTAVADRPPVAVATASPPSGPAPLTVTLDGTGSSDPDGQALQYRWDLGNGSTATTPTVTATFDAGTHTATLTVTDGALSATTTVTITATQALTKPAAPVLTASASGSTVLLAWTDVVGEAAYDLYREVRQRNGTYKGRTLVRTLAADSTGTTDTPSAGTYRYRLVARNSAGSSASAYTGPVVVGSGTRTKTGG